MAQDELTIRIVAAQDGEKIDLAISEIAVLLTAVNRALNKGIYAELRETVQPHIGSYDAIGQEPALVEFRVSSARSGSVELQTIANFLSDVGLDPATAKELLVGIIGSLIVDPSKLQTLSNDVRRGVTRISKAAAGKVFRVVLKMRDRTLSVSAEVSRQGKTRVYVDHYPPDDVQ